MTLIVDQGELKGFFNIFLSSRIRNVYFKKLEGSLFQRLFRTILKNLLWVKSLKCCLKDVSCMVRWYEKRKVHHVRVLIRTVGLFFLENWARSSIWARSFGQINYRRTVILSGSGRRTVNLSSCSKRRTQWALAQVLFRTHSRKNNNPTIGWTRMVTVKS